MKFGSRIIFLFGLLLACNSTLNGPTRGAEGPTASDGTPCIRIDASSCIVQEEQVKVVLEPFLSLVSECSGYCNPDYYPRNKFIVDKFDFEWGYFWKLNTIARRHYIPNTSEGTLRYTGYELTEVVSRDPVSPGFEFNVQLYQAPGTISSGLEYFQVTDEKKMYIDKPFQCPLMSVCDGLFRLKEQIKNGTAKICSMKISLRFQGTPEDDLELTAVEYENCK